MNNNNNDDDMFELDLEEDLSVIPSNNSNSFIDIDEIDLEIDEISKVTSEDIDDSEFIEELDLEFDDVEITLDDVKAITSENTETLDLEEIDLELDEDKPSDEVMVKPTPKKPLSKKELETMITKSYNTSIKPIVEFSSNVINKLSIVVDIDSENNGSVKNSDAILNSVKLPHNITNLQAVSILKELTERSDINGNVDEESLADYCCNYILETNNSLVKASIIDFIRELSKQLFIASRSRIEYDSIKNGKVIKLMNLLFSDRKFLRSMPNSDEYKIAFVDFIELGKDSFSYVCPSCNQKHTTESNLINCIRVNDLPSVLIYPILCRECKLILLLKPRVISAIHSKFMPYITDPAFARKSLGNISLYVPSNIEVASVLGDMCQVVEDVSEDSSESVDIDWDNYRKSFMDMQELYYKNSLDSGSVGVKNLAKIIAAQSNDYSDLKYNAVSTLINEFRNSRINRVINQESIYRNQIPSWYSSVFDEVWSQMSIDIPCDNRKSIESVREAYDKYLKELPGTETRFDNVVEKIISSAELFANIPISNTSLTDEDKQDFLSNPKLAKAIDLISDLMILSHCSEDFMRFYRPRKFDGIREVSVDGEFKNLYKKLTDLRYEDKLQDTIGKFQKFMDNSINNHRILGGSNKESVSIFSDMKFSANFINKYEFVTEIVNMLKYLLSGDYFEAQICKHKLYENNLELVNSLEGPKFKPLKDLIISMPCFSSGVTKFEYYFGNGDYTDEEKNLLLDCRDRKKFVPLTLEGNTFKDKLAYYNSLEFSDVPTKVFKDMDDFVDSNMVEILAYSYLDYKSNYKDSITTYYISQDMLLGLSKCNLNILADVLYVNKEILSIYMSEEYDLSGKEFDMSRLIKFIYFRSLNTQSIVDTVYDSESDFRKEMLSDRESILNESRINENIAKVVDTFFNKLERE